MCIYEQNMPICNKTVLLATEHLVDIQYFYFSKLDQGMNERKWVLNREQICLPRRNSISSYTKYNSSNISLF